jgi:flagellar hook-length control protein FliK
MQGGGFHFLFNGSLQAYQQARAEAEAGKPLPPQGDTVPEPAATEAPVQPLELSAEQLQSALTATAKPDAKAPDTVAHLAQTLQGMEQPAREKPVAGEAKLTDPDVEVRQQAALNFESAAAAQALRPDQQQAAQVQRQDDQVQRQDDQVQRQDDQVQLQAREMAQQQAQQQAELAAQQAAVKQAAANAVDSQPIQQSALDAGQQRAAEQRADAAAQAARRQADAGAQHAATPARPKPGAGAAAQPAVPAQPAAPLSGLSMSGQPIADDQVQDSSREPIEPAMRPMTSQLDGLNPGADVMVVEQVVVAEEADNPAAVVPNAAVQNGQGMTPAAAAAAQSEAAAETALANTGGPRPGADAAPGRGPAEVISARNEQIAQSGSGTNADMGNDGGEEQPSQRQESQQAQTQAAAAGGRAQIAASAAAQPQQPFSMAQQQLLSDNWGRAMGERAIMMAQHGPRVAHIQLDPPELGAVQIRIHIQAGDQVSVSFTSPSAMVREALEQQMPRLREMFADQGLRLQDSSVADQSPQQQSGQRDQSPQGQAGSSGYAGIETGMGEGVTVQAVKVGLVDYYA